MTFTEDDIRPPLPPGSPEAKAPAQPPLPEPPKKSVEELVRDFKDLLLEKVCSGSACPRVELLLSSIMLHGSSQQAVKLPHINREKWRRIRMRCRKGASAGLAGAGCPTG